MATSTGDGRNSQTNGRDEPTSPASPLAQFPPLPPVESRSRAPEFYGFVAWAVTCLLFVLYFLWAILPDEWIIWLGVTWYPNRCVQPRGVPSLLPSGKTTVGLAIAGALLFLILILFFRR